MEGLAAVIGLAGDADEHVEARMAARSELALVHQELGDLRRADVHLEQAVEAAERLVALSSEPRTAIALASVLLNRASLLVQGRRPEPARRVAARVLDALAPLQDGSGPALEIIRFGARLQLGTAELLLGATESGVTSLEEAFEHGVALVEGGQAALLPQTVETAARLGQGLRASGAGPRALEVTERVARLAAANWEAGGPGALQLYGQAQVLLIQALLAEGAFARAEDALWRLVDGTGDGGALLTAADFYADLWRRADADLESGDLPRAEVGEAWRDVVVKVAERGASPVVAELVASRAALWLDGDHDRVEAAISGAEGADGADPALVQRLVQVLVSERSSVSASGGAGGGKTG